MPGKSEKHIIEGEIGEDIAGILFIHEPTILEGGTIRDGENYQYLGDLLKPHMTKDKIRVTVIIEDIEG